MPQALLEKLVAWQQEFDRNFHWETGWRSDQAREKWAADAVDLEAELRSALTGKAELEVDLWPLNK